MLNLKTHLFCISFLSAFFTSYPLLANIISSFIASILFIHLILVMYKPRIDIWPVIAQKTDSFIPENKMAYWFKIHNKSWFKAFDINVRLYEVVPIPKPDNRTNYRHMEIPLVTNNFNYIARRKSTILHSSYTDNCLIFRTYQDLNAKLNAETKSVRLEVTLRHGLTGISGIYVKEFMKESISAGFFRPGRKVAIDTNNL